MVSCGPIKCTDYATSAVAVHYPWATMIQAESRMRWNARDLVNGLRRHVLSPHFHDVTCQVFGERKGRINGQGWNQRQQYRRTAVGTGLTN